VDIAPATAVSFGEALAAGPIDSDPPIILSDRGQAPPVVDGQGPEAALSAIPTGDAPTATVGRALSADFDPMPAVPSLRPELTAPGFVLTAASAPARDPSANLAVARTSYAPVSAGAVFWPAAVPMLKPGSAPARLPLVYIDPGHGGDDPGTIGRSGIYEKDITIAVAKELQRQLLASGRYRVKLTRETDRFVALRDRFEMARLDHADLFISLHADANPFFDARGATVYTLSETASDAETEALAAKENKSDLIDGVDLSNQNKAVTSILIDLAQRETKNRSAAFAELLVHEMAQVTLMLRNSHRFAGFAVLKAPDIPSVLIELGYLSDSQDEALLLSPAHRAKLAGAMLHAIDGYYSTEMVSGTRS
jgi:N-acetylmuramoyl-L-alanine amidase